MSEDILQDEENEKTVCHINERTRPLFKEMLNKLGDKIQIGKTTLGYGDAIYKVEPEEFESLFNRWVTGCVGKDIMRKTLSTDCTKKIEWSQELSEVERVFLSMEVIKEML
tara:strand:- start:3930 stop:4262 length:333 start_codon:yes stop_codon:yes gene_type:complete